MNKIEKYIVCHSCKIGGYDNCPDCLGAGGYSIHVEESSLTEHIKDHNDKLIQNIYTKLRLIKDRNIWNDEIETKLNSYFSSLIVLYPTSEINKCIENLLRVKSFMKSRKLLGQFLTLKQIMDSVTIRQYSGFSMTGADEYFIIDEYSNKLRYSITKSKSLCLDGYVLDGFFENLAANSLVRFNGYDYAPLFGFFSKNDIETNSFKELVFIDYNFSSKINKFIIQKSLIKPVAVKYVNQLHFNNAQNWYIQSE